MRLELGLEEVATLPEDPLVRVRRHLGTDYVVTGSVTVLPPDNRQIRLEVSLHEAGSGEELLRVLQNGTADGLFELLSAVETQLRRRLGISDLSPEEGVGCVTRCPPIQPPCAGTQRAWRNCGSSTHWEPASSSSKRSKLP